VTHHSFAIPSFGIVVFVMFSVKQQQHKSVGIRFSRRSPPLLFSYFIDEADVDERHYADVNEATAVCGCERGAQQ